MSTEQDAAVAYAMRIRILAGEMKAELQSGNELKLGYCSLALSPAARDQAPSHFARFTVNRLTVVNCCTSVSALTLVSTE